MRPSEVAPRDAILGDLDTGNKGPTAGLDTLASERRDAPLRKLVEAIRLA
jgi:hypothetical protein